MRKARVVKLERARELRWGLTEAEARLWGALRAGAVDGLRFRRQQVIRGFIADFYCHKCRLIIEVDGGVHDDRREADRQRDALLGAVGFRVLRFSNESVIDHLAEVVHAIQTAAWQGPRADAEPQSAPPLPGEGAGGEV